MRALVITGPGELSYQQVPAAPIPEGECRVAVTRAGVCRTDQELLKGYMGFHGIPGHEFVGVVRSGPTQLVGRRVVGEINVAAGRAATEPAVLDARQLPDRTVLGILGRPGAFAEQLCLPPANLLLVPDNLSDDEAVFTEPLAAALQIFEQLELPPGTRLLVIGDGKLGLLIAQACALRELEVTLHGRHPAKLALAQAWGIQVQQVAGGQLAEVEQPFSVVVEATGSADGLDAALTHVAPRGTVVLKSTYAPDRLPPLDAARVVVNEIRLQGSRCGRFGPALELLASGRVDVASMICARFPLDRGVEAFARANEPGALKVVIDIAAR